MIGVSLPELEATIKILDEDIAEAEILLEEREFIAKAATGINRIADRLTPKLRRVFLATVKQFQNGLSLDDLITAIHSKNANNVIRHLNLDKFAKELGVTGTVIQEAFNSAGKFAAMELTRDAKITTSFDLINPRAVDYGARVSGALIKDINSGQLDAVRALVEDAFVSGVPPRETAMRIRDVVGLRDKQVEQYQKFRDSMEAQGIGADIIDQRAEKLAGAMIRSRAETISRTEIMDSANAGQAELWMQARENGLIDDRRTTRKWLIGPSACDEICAPMEDQEVGMDEDFETGEGESIGRPPAHPRCVCSMRLVIKR